MLIKIAFMQKTNYFGVFFMLLFVFLSSSNRQNFLFACSHQLYDKFFLRMLRVLISTYFLPADVLGFFVCTLEPKFNASANIYLSKEVFFFIFSSFLICLKASYSIMTKLFISREWLQQMLLVYQMKKDVQLSVKVAYSTNCSQSALITVSE
jgi:hypothetical protein